MCLGQEIAALRSRLLLFEAGFFALLSVQIGLGLVPRGIPDRFGLEIEPPTTRMSLD
jgi:hypothetical protein